MSALQDVRFRDVLLQFLFRLLIVVLQKLFLSNILSPDAPPASPPYLTSSYMYAYSTCTRPISYFILIFCVSALKRSIMLGTSILGPEISVHFIVSALDGLYLVQGLQSG